MALAGPRLDRPSAIGDEGRPRATSLWIASAAVAAIVAANAVAMGWLAALTGIVTFAGLTAAGIALLDGDRFAAQLVGHGLVIAFGTLLALTTILPALDVGFGLAACGSALALFGIAASWTDTGTADGFHEAVWATGRTVTAMVAWLVALSLLVVVGGAAYHGIRSFAVHSPPPAVSAAGFCLLLAGSAVAALAALAWLPFRQLAPRAARRGVVRRVEAARGVARWTLGAAVVGLFAVLSLEWSGALPLLLVVFPSLSVALAALSSAPVVVAIVAVSVGMLASGGVARALRWLARSRGPRATRHTAGAVVGLAYLVLGVLVAMNWPFAAVVVPWLGAELLVVAAFLGPFVLLGLLALARIAIAVGLCPDRAGGPAMAAAGLCLAAVGVAVARGPAPLVFASVAGAVVVWDSATFGLGVTAELGHRPRTKRLELARGVVAVAIGLSLVAVATGVEALRRAPAVADVGGAGALLVVLLGALVFLVQIRG